MSEAAHEAVMADRVSTLLESAVTRKSDGQDGPPQAIPDRPKPVQTNTPGALNSALSEPEPDVSEGVDPNHRFAAHVKILDAEQGLVQGIRKKIAICGFASSSRNAIPVESDEWEIWTLNQFYRHTKRSDRHFDMHWNWDSENVPGTDHRGWIRGCGVPTYMIRTHPDLPTSMRYPIDRLIKKFGDYFTSSVAEMLAVLIDEIDRRVEADLLAEMSSDAAALSGADALARSRNLYADYTIGIFGIDLVVGEEYFWQKACAEFWIGIALGRNINVLIPPQSALCKQRYRYGYETEPPTIIKPREIEAHKNMLTEQHAEGLKRLNMMEGALQILLASSDAPAPNVEELKRERDGMIKKLLMLDGCMEADAYWNELIELRLRGADVRI